jgi:hypothetical protein
MKEKQSKFKKISKTLFSGALRLSNFGTMENLRFYERQMQILDYKHQKVEREDEEFRKIESMKFT